MKEKRPGEVLERKAKSPQFRYEHMESRASKRTRSISNRRECVTTYGATGIILIENKYRKEQKRYL